MGSMLQHAAEGKNSVETIDLGCFVKQLIAGELPVELAELTVIGRRLAPAAKLGPQAIAVIIAAAKECFGAKRLSDWVAWCKVELALNNASYRCHLAQVGEMLNGLRKNHCFIKQYKTIFGMNLDSQLALTKISPAELGPFLSHYPNIDEMDRGAIRAAVTQWLNPNATEPVPAPAEQPLLPGFDEALDAIVAIDDKKWLEVAASPRFNAVAALKMSCSGMTLCSASVGYLADHADELDDDMLAELAESAEMIHNRLAAAVADRRRKLLNN